MPTPVCANCRRTIPPEDINVANDVAYCRDCNVSYRLDELMDDDGIRAADAERPPAGAWLDNCGNTITFGARHRGLSRNLMVLVAALFWNGLLACFLVALISATLTALHLPIPDFFPPLKTHGRPPTLGFLLFLWCFLSPFIVLGFVLAWTVFSYLFGKTVIRVANSQAVVFAGIGFLGSKKCFALADIRDVASSISPKSSPNDEVAIWIETKEGKMVKFGTQLSVERARFVVATLRKYLLYQTK